MPRKKKGSNDSSLKKKIPYYVDDYSKDVCDLSIEYIIPDDCKKWQDRYNTQAAISRQNKIIENCRTENLSKDTENDFSSFSLVSCGIMNERDFTENNLYFLQNIGCFVNVDVNTIVISNGKKAKFIHIGNREIKDKIFKGIMCGLITVNGTKLPDITTVRQGDVETITLRLKEYVSDYISKEKRSTLAASNPSLSSAEKNNSKKKSFISSNPDDYTNSHKNSTDRQIEDVFKSVDEQVKKNSLGAYLDSIPNYDGSNLFSY